MSKDESPCPICKNKGERIEHLSDVIAISCPRCGKFKLTGSADAMVQATSPRGRIAANASAWIREHQGITIGSNDVEQLWYLTTPPVAERAMKVLQALERRYPKVGTSFGFKFPDVEQTDPYWLSVSWSESSAELLYLLVSYLSDSRSAIEILRSSGSSSISYQECRITPKGFELLDQLKQGNPESVIGFCAMSFSNDLKPLWTSAIEPAIRAAGYQPLRIDQHEHVNRIDDEIIAAIRRSRFVVADFTGQRGGVYFEAGYALGQGLRIIWTCREDDLKNVHFDTRQYNFLVWKPSEYGDMAKRLQNRIEATLGRGPIKNN